MILQAIREWLVHGSDASWDLANLLNAAEFYKCRAYLVGGAVADIVIWGSAQPVDIDVVIMSGGNHPVECIISMAGLTTYRESRFGGFKTKGAGGLFDVWSCPTETIEEHIASFTLDIETVAVDIYNDKVVDLGFSNALKTRTVKINSLDLTDIETATQRAINKAARYGFTAQLE